MWQFKITFFIIILCSIYCSQSARSHRNSKENHLCNEETIKKALDNLDNSKLEIYDHIDDPSFDKIMSDYTDALKIFKTIANNIVASCPNINQSNLKAYLDGHHNMEQCSEALLKDDFELVERTCPQLYDQGNINCVVNYVVNGTEGFDHILDYCTRVKTNIIHKILFYNALSQESQAGVENYKKLFQHIKQYLSDQSLTQEEKEGFAKVAKHLIWSSFKNNPPIAYPDLMEQAYQVSEPLGQNIARDLVVDAVDKKLDILQLQLLIEHIPNLSCKIRAYLYVYGHLADYPNADEAKFRLAYPMYTLRHSPNYTAVDSQLRASLSAAYETLPEYAKEFMSSGEVCFQIANLEGKETERKNEDVFIKIHAGRRKTTNEYLFVESPQGRRTRCDRSGVVSYFFKTGPPENISLVQGSTRTTGDFRLNGPEGVDCNVPWTSRNVYFCCFIEYMLSNFHHNHDDFIKFAQAHASQHADKFSEKCLI